MSANRISYGRTPNNIPFVNENINTLNQFSQKNGYIYFNGRRLGFPLSVSQYNQQQNGEGESSSSYNIQFSNIQNIVFQGATVKQNPYDKSQVRVVIDKTVEPNLQNVDGDLIIRSQYYILREITSSIKQVQYNATKKQFLICNGQKPITIKLPRQAKDMDYVKISTLDKINANNVVNIVVTRLGVYINSTNETMLTIDSPYSSVQLVYSRSTHTWLVLTPFIPVQRDTVGLTNQQAIRNAKKQMLIFG